MTTFQRIIWQQDIADYVYNLTGKTMASASVSYLIPMAVMLVLLFLIAWKRPKVQVEEMATSTVSGEQKQMETEAIKYCQNCGTALLADSAFCTNCGAKQ
ncbi:MAG: zinc ribbon domain-containing protein [Lachnospiraceae bacterium]|nr:zinc ribbon domain-containing protein [Lachnospiraceae bacterium]